MRITPDLIPHTEFHTGAWLQSAERPSWYYFSKKLNPNIITNKDFMQSVDEPLKEIVQFLHAHGIKTTPSCSGHYFNREKFERIYDELVEDSALIKQEGLMMRDIETGELHLYKSKTYALPWTKNEFLERIKNYQGKGVLGLHTGNRKKLKHELLSLKMEHVKISERGNIVLFLTGEDGAGDIRETWKAITKQVKLVFDAHDFSYPVSADVKSCA